MKTFSNWSIRYKLLSLLMMIGLSAFAATATLAYFRIFQALEQNSMNQLDGLRRSRASQIEDYYHVIHRHVLTLSEDRMFIAAIKGFGGAYRRINARPVPKESRKPVREDYLTRFYPEVQRLHMGRPRVEDYLPVTPAAIQLQAAYIAKSPHPPEWQREMVSTHDNSAYSRIHAVYHRAFRRIIEKFGYYNLYLIDDSGNVVYDVNKNRDFATNLLYGPYRNSNLAKVVRQCLATEDPDDVVFSDFEPYEPSQGQPTQFVASPIFEGKKRLGVFALQLSTDAIDRVMTGSRGWQKDGLGRTGEAVIYGSDYLLRTNARGYLENPDAFLSRLKAGGFSEDTINRIRAYKTTILLLGARFSSVTAALEGKEGHTIEKSIAGGKRLLVSFMPLNIEGLHWVILARKNLDEAFQPVGEMKRLFGWWGLGLLLPTLLAALLMTRQILRPVKALVNAAQCVAAGDLTAKVHWKWKDELGMLSNTFNSMTRSIREKMELIEQKNGENEALLLNILPAEIASRLKEGEHEIADSFADVTVLFGDLVGFTTLSSQIPAAEVVDMLNGLFSRFDQAASELGIEKIKTIGDCYMAVCGLPRPCSDHAERMARMALMMLEATREFGQELGLPLQIRVGLNSGQVVAGVIGKTKFIYDLWGDTVNLASRMESTGVPGQIQVTESVHDRLKNDFELESRGTVPVKGKGEIETWLLHGQLHPAEVLK